MKRRKVILSSQDIERVRQLKAYAETHLAADLRVETLASLFNTSVSTLQRHFYTCTGMNIHHHIISLRMEKAKALLLNRVPVDQVGTMVGYTERTAFTHAFHRYAGCTPVDFLKKNADKMDAF